MTLRLVCGALLGLNFLACEAPDWQQQKKIMVRVVLACG